MNLFMNLLGKGLIIFCLIFLGEVNYLKAAPIVNSFGLSSADTLITFDEFVFPQNTLVSTEYSSLGVTFSPALNYDNNGGGTFPGQSGHHLANFSPTKSPFSILFTNNVTEAAFGFVTNAGTSTFVALLDGVQVETFDTFTTFNNSSTAFIGFTGIVFNEISISPGFNGNASIDNLQFNRGVPEMSSFFSLIIAGILASASRFSILKRE